MGVATGTADTMWAFLQGMDMSLRLLLGERCCAPSDDVGQGGRCLIPALLVELTRNLMMVKESEDVRFKIMKAFVDVRDGLMAMSELGPGSSASRCG